ncbi:MAG: hypothetical protein A2Y82_03790 [Candidatus Buchananbacteria bacterium RBG_13_36_9]|uniref:Uncharacterized protein n=1 Tax=Candidatus Buchananbacteria bacterium RBG_13_36_9 TaxID=1797530 RepID=A0A1G1XMD8_9BACT|nr:MAG: hypothetical protein A2Y82_03790 [Candidatus Buchananbacteria bacterium RBG_13_36_9]
MRALFLILNFYHKKELESNKEAIYKSLLLINYFFFACTFLRHFNFGNLTPVVIFLPLAIILGIMNYEI